MIETGSNTDELNAELDRRYGSILVAGQPYLDVFRNCIAASGTTVAPDKVLDRAERGYRLAEALDRVLSKDGEGFAEAGVWRGFSARLMALLVAHRRPGWRGKGLVLVDSFEGLSAPRVEDASPSPDGWVVARHTTNFASGEGIVRQTLSDFPDVAIHAGWIPPVLNTLSERTYCFVHLDTDLYEPTAACLAYFSSRMMPGGCIVDDDYGSGLFPGVRRAWDRFARGTPGRFEVLESGQCVWSADAEPAAGG